jgi:hypothetical protein
MSFEDWQKYNSLYETWNPADFDANKWMDDFKESNLKMFAFTTKHHEGFSMFNTKTRVKSRVNWTVPNGPIIESCDIGYSIMETFVSPEYCEGTVRCCTQTGHEGRSLFLASGLVWRGLPAAGATIGRDGWAGHDRDPIPQREIQPPILIDVRTGKITPAAWRSKEVMTVAVDLKDSVTAVADASYLDWPLTPDAPAGLVAKQSVGEVQLEWKAYGGFTGFEIQRSSDRSSWQKVTKLRSDRLSYSEKLPSGRHITYRVRALGQQAPSACSNPTWVGEMHWFDYCLIRLPA